MAIFGIDPFEDGELVVLDAESDKGRRDEGGIERLVVVEGRVEDRVGGQAEAEEGEEAGGGEGEEQRVVGRQAAEDLNERIVWEREEIHRELRAANRLALPLSVSLDTTDVKHVDFPHFPQPSRVRSFQHP